MDFVFKWKMMTYENTRKQSMQNCQECFWKGRKQGGVYPLLLKLKATVFQNLCHSACFWGAQHDTVMISLSLNYILMGMSEFNCNSEVFIQIKEHTKEAGLRFLKLHVTASRVSGGLWIQKAVLVIRFPLSYVFGLCFLNICLCDLVLFLGGIIWLVSHPAQFLPVLLVILLLGTPPSALFWLGHLYAPLGLGPRSSPFSPLLHPCRWFQNSRFSHSLICN